MSLTSPALKSEPSARPASRTRKTRPRLNAQPAAIARLNYDVPSELERITLKCLQKAPDRRYQSALELMVDLRNLARQLEHGGANDSALIGRSEPTAAFTPNRGGNAVEPFSLEKLKSSDVLLNYAAIDDYPLHDGKPGWVSQLHRNLEVRMEQLSGEKIRIGRLSEDSVAPAEPTKGKPPGGSTLPTPVGSAVISRRVFNSATATH